MPRPLAVLALGAFLAVDAVLVVGAYRAVNNDPPASDLSVAETPAPETGNEQTAFEFDPATAAVLDVTNDGTVLLATRGTCGGPPGTVQTGSGNGAELTARNPGLQTVLNLQIESPRNLVIVGTGEDCAPQQLRSDDGGASWDEDDEITLWYPSPTDVRSVVAPGGRASEPGCTVTSLSQVDANFARVTCADGVVRGTGNGGAEWVILGRLDNIRTATFTTFDTGYALARFEGCAAYVFTTNDSGATWTDQSCIVGDPARAIASSDTALVSVVGADPQVFVSDDAGVTFARP